MPRAACPFCQIINTQSSASVVYRDEQVVAFRDIHPVAPVHILIVPIKHVNSLNDLEDGDSPLLMELFSAARKVAVQLGIDGDGYRLVLNTGANAGQSVFHLHVHLLGGRRMHWPPG